MSYVTNETDQPSNLKKMFDGLMVWWVNEIHFMVLKLSKCVWFVKLNTQFISLGDEGAHMTVC